MDFTRLKRFFSMYDYSIVILVLILSFFGVIVIGSATGLGLGDVSSVYSWQKIWLVSGVAIMIGVSFLDYQFVCRFYIPLYAVSIALLVLVLVFGGSKDTARWLDFPKIGGWQPPSIQPSEFSKIFVLIFLAKYIDKMQERINNMFVLFSILVIGLLPTVLIYEQPSLSASLLQLVVLLVMLYVGGVKYKYILIALAIVVPLLVFLRYDLSRDQYIIIDKITTNYQRGRLNSFFGIGETDPDKVYQTNQAIKALGTGMLTGRGLYNNVTHIPLSYNDFIFALIGAEFGFVGCMAVILIILAVVAKCFLAAYRSDSLCGRLLAAGIGAMLGAQSFIHIGVNTGFLPNTGIPLPFVSAGGSSMWINFAAVGIAINVGMKHGKTTIFTDK